MPFITPALFWAGAAAASGPVIIHLLNRRRFRILDWAAMEFLLQSQRKNRRRVKIEELILLLLRVLAILLMGSAIARPFLSRNGLLDIIGKSSKDVVVILDDSYSMAQKHEAGTVFTKAQDDLMKLASMVGKQDTFAVFLTSRPNPFFAPNYLAKVEEFGTEVRALSASDYGTKRLLSEAVASALKVFEESHNIEKRLYILSDFRKQEWNAESDQSQTKAGDPQPSKKTETSLQPEKSEGQLIASQLAKLDSKRFKLFLVDYGPTDSTNLTVQKLECAEIGHVVKNVRLQFRVTVVNNGPQTVQNVPLTFLVGETPQSRILDRLDPNQPKSVDFSYRFKDPGPASITASIPGDPLGPDNAAYLALNVMDAIPVLVVNGNPDVEQYKNEPDYFVAALDPGGKNLSGFRSDVVLDRDLPNFHQKISGYDCVVLANVASLLPDSLKVLREYVKNGGGLVVFLGDKIDREFYNTQMYEEGKGLLPLAVEREEGSRENLQRFAKLKNEAPSHPIMKVFEGAGEQLLSLVPFYTYYPLRFDPVRAAGVNVLASLVPSGNIVAAQNTPAIVEKNYGRGRVIEIATSMNRAWNDWPQSVSYPIVMNEMVGYLCRAPRHENTNLVGEPLRREIETEFFDSKISLKSPKADQNAIEIAPKLEGAQMFVTWPSVLENAGTTGDGHPKPIKVDRSVPGLDYAGHYTMELKATAKTKYDYFARNVDPDEGRLEKADEAVVRLLMKDVANLEYGKQLGMAGGGASGSRELWRVVLFALLGVLVLETILAQRFGHYSS